MTRPEKDMKLIKSPDEFFCLFKKFARSLFCGCSVAVTNAVPALKEHVDFVTNGSRGDGVIELIEKLITSDLAEFGH
jgi:hypothetical protein